jgi:aminocarboxymuconate-semialdehyde decarboxylase
MTVVDFHNHYYPPAYLDAIRRGPSRIEVTDDAEGNPVLHSPGDVNVAVRGHRDIAYRQEVLDGAGVDRQVITLTAPGTLLESPARAVELAGLVNDALAEVVSERGNRFSALATLPLNDPSAAAAELDRAMDELGLPGAMLFGNVNGTPLYDERFHPLYERAARRRAVLYIHPTYPAGVESMSEYWLMPLVGFLFDTTLAAAGLVMSGAVARYEGIRWVLGHLGGAIPYLAERLDRGHRAFEACRRNIDRRPSEYLQDFYYDTVNFDPAALRLALDFAGAGHLLAGSDYPHQIGSLEQMRESLDALDLPADDRSAVFGGNALALLGLADS